MNLTLFKCGGYIRLPMRSVSRPSLRKFWYILINFNKYTRSISLKIFIYLWEIFYIKLWLNTLQLNLLKSRKKLKRNYLKRARGAVPCSSSHGKHRRESPPVSGNWQKVIKYIFLYIIHESKFPTGNGIQMNNIHPYMIELVNWFWIIQVCSPQILIPI